MSLLDRVDILVGRRREDSRGWLHVALGASQLPPDARFGELYVVRALALGDRRGDHFHPTMDEWFTVVDGSARLELVDPETRERRAITLTSSDPQTVFVPAGLAHCFVNITQGPLTIIAWATGEYDPEDVVPLVTS